MVHYGHSRAIMLAVEDLVHTLHWDICNNHDGIGRLADMSSEVSQHNDIPIMDFIFLHTRHS